mmetsp:Transcript_1091/g.1904  ORF Transcript_1091/g.1904 Transcript_1091/m.1904 type:complete len:324 (-) Transcript_1091:186-1157(-)|eukprot:CAMPEP_0183725172 /NCGR_PEP_ID=MMETSP0737-20130205/19666_1 /TAXON_ID=385413 /ORGANISM="Thalassiosira miniscula, Strain CCMP1093" /LENGTH=323 /DNA_ID=CAMNT_0025956019 /DNA_START=90 /DNA_END=1061 /DNA_ORIENTATION=-
MVVRRNSIKLLLNKKGNDDSNSSFNLSSSSLNLNQNLDLNFSSGSLGSFDLPKNYQNAIECLIQCDSVINSMERQLKSKDEQIASLEQAQSKTTHDDQVRLRSLQKKLASKDDRIAALEEQVVKLSFELASLKAFEDEHRTKRNDSYTSDSDSDKDEAGHLYDSCRLDTSCRLDSSCTSGDGRRRVSVNFGQFLFGVRNHSADAKMMCVQSNGEGHEDDARMRYSTNSCPDISVSGCERDKVGHLETSCTNGSGRRGSSIGQFLFGGRNHSAIDEKTNEVPKGEGREDDHRQMSMVSQQTCSSRSFIDGVVFPVSDEDIDESI